MQRNIKLTISYDGTKYSGWQKQGNSSDTIQGKIEKVLSKMTGEKISIIGAGRTDAGVHAKAQIANFRTSSKMTTTEILNYCYTYLPKDIVIYGAKVVNDRFHARHNTRGKVYCFYIDNNPYHNVFHRKYAVHIPSSLDVEAMIEASQLFIGQHDFTSFAKIISKKKSPVKTIDSIDITREKGQITISYTAKSFLYRMARILSGALIQVGQHKLTIDDIKMLLDSPTKKNKVTTAPGQGLVLEEVLY